MQRKECFFNKTGFKEIAVFSLVYLIISYFIVGFKTDQLVLIAVMNVLFFFSKQTRRILIVCLPYIIFWILFDYMKAFPNYNCNPVHIKELYEAEKNLFGIPDQGIILTPNEYFMIHHNSIFDVLSGIFYLSWVTVPVMLTIYFLYTKKEDAIHLPLTFLLVNIIGFAVYYIYPAAPPWYVSRYGFEFIKHTPGSAAGLARFDSILNTNLFHSMYEKSSNVFAAMPSLHSAYPVVALYFACKNKLKWGSAIIGCTAVGIWFSAVYTSHHYIMDTLCGILCAAVGIIGYEIIFNKLRSIKNGILYLIKLVLD